MGAGNGMSNVQRVPTIQPLATARRIGYLFGGGSMRCAFQVGVVEELDALGIRPAATLGVSAGAWNAAAVGVGNARRLRNYWRFFSRMPYIDLRNLGRELSPFIFARMHERAFRRYVGVERLRGENTMPILIAATRLRDGAPTMFDLRKGEDPLRVCLATNYLPPFYSRAPEIDGEKYGDGGISNNVPYEALFEAGCDAVIIVSCKGESEGGLYRSPREIDHVIPPEFASRIVVIRPRHRMPLGFNERRWDRLTQAMFIGALRTREVLLGETHRETNEWRDDSIAFSRRAAGAMRLLTGMLMGERTT